MKKVIFIMCTFILLTNLISVYAYDDEVNLMKNMCVLKGYEDGELRLEDTVSRAEFVKMIIMASKFKDNLFSSESNPYFSDVNSNHWAYTYIETAAKNNIISEYEDKTFKPDNAVSLEEALAVVLKLINDSHKTSETSWKGQQIEAAKELGLTKGVYSSTEQPLSRENVIKLLKNLLFIKNKNGKSYIENIGYTTVENTKIIAKDNNGYFLTSNGIYEVKTAIAEDAIGTTGCLVLDGEIVVGFIQNNASKVEITDELVTETYSGPYIVKTSNWKEDFCKAIDDAIITKNGKPCSIEKIEINDVLYYAENVNKLQAYNDKITGVYQAASPNTKNPEKITVSGKEYTINSVHAYSKIYDEGEFTIGDSITLLLGRNGDVVDVTDAGKTKDELVGYVADVGVKNFTIGEVTTKHYYASIRFADGQKFEYITKGLYSNLKNRVVKIKFEDKYAKLNRVNETYKNYGVFDLKKRMFGEEKLSDDIIILDVYSPYSDDISLSSSIKPERIDHVYIANKQILYCHKNSAGEIDKLILHNVTGDMIKYGLCVKADKDFKNMKAQYTYDILGTLYNLSTNKMIYSIEKGVPAMFVTADGKVITTTKSLTHIKDSLKLIDKNTASSKDKIYPISEYACVYLKNHHGTYLTMTIEELVENADKYYINAYYDKDSKYGGCIRIFVVNEK